MARANNSCPTKITFSLGIFGSFVCQKKFQFHKPHLGFFLGVGVGVNGPSGVFKKKPRLNATAFHLSLQRPFCWYLASLFHLPLSAFFACTPPCSNGLCICVLNLVEPKTKLGNVIFLTFLAFNQSNQLTILARLMISSAVDHPVEGDDGLVDVFDGRLVVYLLHHLSGTTEVLGLAADTQRTGFVLSILLLILLFFFKSF